MLFFGHDLIWYFSFFSVGWILASAGTNIYFGLGLPCFSWQATGFHWCESTGLDGHLLKVDWAEVANR